ncbi:MAG: hypothetical protein ACKVHS_01455 [Flavobacteriales bacterium]|jgi:hypothetical protein|tara:strand:- start:745 stop:2148 length:1404 start_codon:yes stop_codon:yes gene_type:complete
MNKLTLFSAIFLSCFSTKGQDLDYFAQLNQPMTFGDARYNGLSGAMVAMSGSFSALALNPAGAALYRQDAFGFDMGLFNSKNTDVNSSNIRGNTTNLNVGNFGFLGKNPSNGVTLFFTYNSDQIYRERLRANSSDAGSIMQQWINNSDGTPPEYLNSVGVYEDLLYQSYATDWNSNNRSYFSSAALSNVSTEHLLFRKGMRNRWTLGGANQVNSTFYYGASVSIVHSFEKVEVQHKETFNSTNDLTNLNLEDLWDNSGIGITANAGFLYRPYQFLRIASAIELPHIYGFSQDWEVTMSSVRPSVSAVAIDAEGYGTEYQWSMITAPKLRNGATFILGRTGLISLSHTAIPHSWSQSIGNDNDENYLNPIIDSLLSTQHVMAAGGEFRIRSVTLRGGIGYSPSYRDNENRMRRASLGASIRSEELTLHLAWSAVQQQKQYYTFSADYTDPIEFQNTISFISMGAVWKF